MGSGLRGSSRLCGGLAAWYDGVSYLLEVGALITGYIQDLIPLPGDPIQYHLDLGSDMLHLNPYIGGRFRAGHTGAKACTFCGRKVNKLFANGSCYPCFRGLPHNDMCIVKPHLCHYDTCRNQAWGDANCMIPTYLYIAKSSDIKVGISRNIPGRWMEQGAVEAVPVALLPTRKMAGDLELFLSQHMPDKTNWRRMLKGEVTETPLSEVLERVLALIPDDFQTYILPPQEHLSFTYPVGELLETFSSLDLEAGPVEGKLLGIKAKYLILDTGVFNAPKYAGFQVELDLTPAAGAQIA